jgi:chromate transporter
MPPPVASDGGRVPVSPGRLFAVFSLLALQGFGGVLAVAQRVLVEEQRWLTREQFVELLAVGQVLPGPNVCNVALMVGDRFFGWRGAAAALAGMLAAPLAIVLTLAAVYAQFAGHPVVGGAIKGMGAVAVGMVAGTALKLSGTLRGNPLRWPASTALLAASFVAVGVLRWPLMLVLPAAGAIGCGLAWHRLRRTDAGG